MQIITVGGGPGSDTTAIHSGDAAGGDLTGTLPNPTIGALKVVTGNIAAGAITLAKLAALAAKGSVPVGGTAGAWVDHAVGNDGEVMVADAAMTDGWRNAVLNLAKWYNDLLGESFDVAASSGGTGTVLSAAAQLCLARIPLLRSMSVTNVLYNLSTLAGSTLTHAFAGLIKSDGTVVGQTADQSTTWQSGGTSGFKRTALSGGPFTIAPLAANDFVWGFLYCGTSAGTLPGFWRSSPTVSAAGGLGLNTGLAAARMRAGKIAQADTATIGSITVGSVASDQTLYWMGMD